jgi:hypothetical protein
VLATAVLRSRERGAYAALFVIVATASPMLGLLILLAGCVTAVYFRLRRLSLPPVGGRAITVAVIFTVLSLARVATAPGFHLPDLWRHGRSPAVATAAEERPDIFLLLLDGYPRGDTLRSWGYDNSAFERSLAARGLAVSDDAHTNYPQTALVLPTMFHMRHASEIAAISGQPSDVMVQRRAVRASLSDPPALEYIEDLGYTTLSAGNPGSYMTLGTQRYLDPGGASIFEHQLVDRTAFSGLSLPFLLDSYRERTLVTLDQLPSLAADAGSVLMFAHLIAPHTPFVFDRDGEYPILPCDRCHHFAIQAEDSGMTTAEFRRSYADQLHYLNERVLESVDGIIEGSPDAVIVIFSDHGSRSDRPVDEEWYRTFFAARTPDHPDLFADDARPLDIFPALLGAYFGIEVETPPDRHYLAPRGRLPLDIVEWDVSP